MNCTAFGLSVAIPALIAFSVLQGRTQVMMDELNESAVGLMNLILANRDKMRLAVAAPVEDEEEGAEAEA
jgi:biopolymer transport protein ExbB/TolQ